MGSDSRAEGRLAVMTFPLPPSSSRFEFRALAAVGFCSIKVHEHAPRERASRPKLPAPANKSRQLAPWQKSNSQLNMVSLARSEVGLSLSVAGKLILRPRCLPEIIRNCPVCSDFGCDFAGEDRRFIVKCAFLKIPL